MKNLMVILLGLWGSACLAKQVLGKPAQYLVKQVNQSKKIEVKITKENLDFGYYSLKVGDKKTVYAPMADFKDRQYFENLVANCGASVSSPNILTGFNFNGAEVLGCKIYGDLQRNELIKSVLPVINELGLEVGNIETFVAIAGPFTGISYIKSMHSDPTKSFILELLDYQ